jgi:hypothetical protein
MAATCWLIGSYPDLPAANITVVDHVAASEGQTVAAGDYYVHSVTASLSLLEAVKAAVNAHSNIADCNAGMTKSGHVRIWRTGGQTFGVTWGASGEVVRDLLGYVGNLSAASTYTAPLRSPLFWSPGRPESPALSPLGVVGQKIHDTVVSQAGTGTIRTMRFNTYRINEFFWRFLPVSRVWTSSELGGEFFTFHEQVLSRGRRLWLHRDMEEDTTDTTTIVALGSGLGPYMARGGMDTWEYVRDVPSVDALSTVRLEVVQVTEYG